MPSLLHELGRRNVIRVVIAYCVFAWVVAQVADLTFESFGAPDWVMRALLVVLAIGLVFAAAFAWIFELTPEGLKKDEADTRDPVFAAGVRRKLNSVIIVVLSIAVMLLLADKFLLRDTSAAPTAASKAAPAVIAIAVLPFNDLSPDKDQEYFADGISEELQNALNKVKNVRVSSRTSSFAFKGKNLAVPQIAELLNVDHIVEGSVRKVGDRLRISAQLVEVASDSTLWSDSYEKTLEDVFEIQDDIAHRIVDALRVALSPEEARALDAAPKSTENEAALQLFFRANYLLRTRAPENVLTAIDLYRQALALDPRFARARAAMATANMTYPYYARQSGEFLAFAGDYSATAEREALLALQQDDSLAQAYAVLGDIARTRNNWLAAERYYQQALDAEPNDPTANLWYLEFLNDVGHTARAVEYANKAYALDPMSPGANANYTVTLMQDGRCRDIGPYARAAAELGNFFGRIAPVLCAAETGNLATVADLLDDIMAELAISPADDISGTLRKAATDPQQLDEAIRLLTQYREAGDAPDVEVLLLASKNRPADALQILLDFDTDSWSRFASLLWWQGMAPVRQQPAFPALLEKTGLLDYYRASGRWPDACTVTGEDFSC